MLGLNASWVGAQGFEISGLGSFCRAFLAGRFAPAKNPPSPPHRPLPNPNTSRLRLGLSKLVRIYLRSGLIGTAYAVRKLDHASLITKSTEGKPNDKALKLLQQTLQGLCFLNCKERRRPQKWKNLDPTLHPKP